jgi:hypothetical protein
MRRTPQGSVSVHPVSCSLARTVRVALVISVFALATALSPHFTHAQSCGGGETVLVESGASMLYRANLVPDDDVTLVEFDSGMRYLANVSDPGIGMVWTQESFDDSGWSGGLYGVGYETAPPGAASLVQTSVAAGALSVFTRTTFEVTSVSDLNGLFLGADYDDGYAAWVNGVEVFRSTEMPGGALSWNSNATLHESSNGATPSYGTLRDISFVLPYLHAGTNVLAVGVWNSGGATSTDLVLVPRLAMAPNWALPGYVPPSSLWLPGSYGVGYETSTVLPNASSLITTSVAPGTSSVFTRTTFNIADPAAVGSLFLGADYDDGFVAWINGVEVLGSNEMPFGSLGWNSGATLHESSNGAAPNYGTLRDISARGIPALVSGENVLAIGVWNVQPVSTSTDLVLVPRLSSGEDDVCDGVDNDCDGEIDEGFPNFDGDLLKDCVDPDDDNDGFADAFDCSPLDPSNSAPSVLEVKNDGWVRGPVRNLVFAWQDQGADVLYDLAGGLISQLRTDAGVSGALCLPGGNDLGKPEFEDARPAPPAGDAYYYLVRSQKPPSCGTGSYGLATSGAERLPTNDCP